MSDAVTLPPEDVLAEEPQVPTRRLLVFELGGHGFACDMESFREIVPPQPLTRLPGAPDNVCGLINLRGTIVTVIDGGITLGRAPYKRAEGLILLVDYLDRFAAIGVDDVRDIQDVPIDQFAAGGETEVSAAGAVAGGVGVTGARVRVLDMWTRV